jgi:glycosyltransferase involved in cell wall biosynthesis
MSGRGRLCFFAPYAYAIASEGAIEFVGGTEVRQWALARNLVARGFDVAMATCDFGQAPIVVKDGVKLLRTYSIEAGISGFRLVYPRLWKTMRALYRADADAYLANGSSVGAGWTYDAARARRSRFIFLAASDYDAIHSLPRLSTRRERWWYLRALRGADARVAQTEAQRSLFHKSFDVDMDVIPNPVEFPPTPANSSANDIVLWLSTYKEIKRPGWFVELARRLPDVRFVMVGFNPPEEAGTYWEAALRAAGEYPNLEVHGFVSHSLVGEFLSKAALFVHTSPLEGFPMTLLEAWAYSVPSVSTFDPGGVVARHRIGEFVTTQDELVEAVHRLMRSPAERSELGKKARAYVQQHHGPKGTYDPLASLIDRVIARERR